MSKKMYYGFYKDNIVIVNPCPHLLGVKIGSCFCQTCRHNKGIDKTEQFVKCDNATKDIKIHELKRKLYIELINMSEDSMSPCDVDCLYILSMDPDIKRILEMEIKKT